MFDKNILNFEDYVIRVCAIKSESMKFEIAIENDTILAEILAILKHLSRVLLASHFK